MAKRWKGLQYAIESIVYNDDTGPEIEDRNERLEHISSMVSVVFLADWTGREVFEIARLVMYNIDMQD